MFKFPKPLALAGATALLCLASQAQAGTVIYNTGDAATATVAMGVNDDGSLNTNTGSIVANSSRTGIAFKFADGSWRDATSPGCFCEGWGVSANGSSSGYANLSSDGGANNLTFGAPSGVTGSTVTTLASLTSLPGLSVTQEYAPSGTSALFSVKVTITNKTGAVANDVKYVRVMDWDVPPTEFNEYVTIKGVSSTTLLEKSHLDGFSSANPLNTSCDAGCGYGGVDTDVTDAGAADHGAYFRFNFGTLADGESYTFNIYYGATGTESEALAAIGAEGIELYSLGQSNGGEGTGSPATFIFGFSGVGGTPQGVPEPGTLVLSGLALAALGLTRRRMANRG